MAKLSRSVANAAFTATGIEVQNRSDVMNVMDLAKATVACGLSAYVIYSFPIVGQVVIIGLLTLLWLSYAHRVLFRRR